MRYEEGRKKRAIAIIAQGNIKKEGGHWVVPSQSGNGSYVVSYAMNEPICTCPDFENRKAICKHIIAVELTKFSYVDVDGKVAEAQAKRVTYSQNWTTYNIAQNEEVKLFDQLLNSLVGDLPEPEYVRGRPRRSIKDELFCSIQKVYSQLSSRRSASLFEFA